MGEVELDYAIPAPDLTSYVTLFYRFVADLPILDDTERADHAQLRFRLSDGGTEYHFPDGSVQTAPPRHVIGATSGATQVRAVGPLRVFGMGLTPAGWAALVKLDASATTNRVLDADALFGPAIARAAAQLAEESTTGAMTAIVEPLLRQLIARAHSPTLQFVNAVDAWLAGGHSPDIEELARTTGLSRRQVERRCNQLYGAPPKLLARKYRALRAAVALATDGEDVDPAMLEGFYDQSHMIREIKQFTGLTPRRIRDEPGVLAQLTITQRRALGGKVHPIISDT